MSNPGYLKAIPEGIQLSIYTQPRASKSAAVGLHGTDLKVRVAAPPVEGAANEELVEYFSKLLKVPKSRITISQGAQSRHKLLRIAGISEQQASQAIEEILRAR